MKVRIKKLHSDATIPTYAKDGDAGMDLTTVSEPKITETYIEYDTGLAMEIPKGYELQIRSRSGAAIDHGLIVLNQPGTVDSDFRGSIGIVIWNITNVLVTIEAGTRIAQGVIAPVVVANFLDVAELSDTTRGSGGFGSTG